MIRRARAAMLAIPGLVLALATGAAPVTWGPEDVQVVSVLASTGDVRSGVVSKLRRFFGGADEGLFVRPFGVAWSADTLFVSDPETGVVTRIDSHGKLARSPEGRFVEPIGIAVCQGRVLLADAALGEVVELTADLEVARVLADGLERPTGVACVGDSAVVANTGGHHLVEIGPDGSRRQIGRRGEGAGEFNYPTCVASADGRIVVGDAMNFRVQIIDSDGSPRESFGALGDGPGTMSRIKGLAVDADGLIWLSDAYRDELNVYDATGSLLMTVGSPGSEVGQFRFPSGIAISASGKIAIADSLNGRVQVLQVRRGGSR